MNNAVRTKRGETRLLVLGFIVACGLCISLLKGLRLQMQTARRTDVRREHQACNTLRDTVRSWAYVLAARANYIGTEITLQEKSLPFLIPDEKISAAIEEHMHFIDGLHGVDSYRNPSTLWYAAVEHADRAMYEDTMSAKYGFNVSINDVGYHGGFNFVPSLQPAPERPTYYPLSVIWGPFGSPAFVRLAVGRDAGPTSLNIRPQVLSSRMFDERKITANPPFDPIGTPIVDDAVILSIPYCGSRGCDDVNATIRGIAVHTVSADYWGSLFPSHVQVTALGGYKVKSVDASRYSARVEAYESYLDLELRCYYDKQSVFENVGSYLIISAIGLLILIVALVGVYFLDVKLQHQHDRSAWVCTQLRILNAMPDAIVSMTFTTDDDPSMDVLNQDGDHALHGRASTIALSDMVSTDELARVRGLFKDPSRRSVAFESRFVGSEQRAITYEVTVSPIVASGSMSHERVCIFRDVSDRVHREEESRRAAASLASAEETNAAEALASAEERLRDNVKMDRYLSHEFKNRIIVLLDSIRCARSDFDVPDSPLPDGLRARLADITEISEDLLATTNLKSVRLHLATGSYDARLEDTDVSRLLETRLARYVDAGRAVVLAPTVGVSAARETSLLMDPVLFNIILGNVLSNALKYGDANQPPSVALRIEPVEHGVVSVSLTVRNAAGPGHEHLLEIGESELNRIAAMDGARAHGQIGAKTSEGDGFPMALASARTLGGTLRLAMSQSEVCAQLSLPRVSLLESAAHFGAMEISELSIALVDDSVPARKMIKRKLERAFSSCLAPIVAGETHASIESFPRTVVDADTDVLFVDQNFGEVHQTKVGTDLVREIRALDLEAGSLRRLIFVVSANDAPSDLALYLASGADGHISKTTSIEQICAEVCRKASNTNRFRGRVTLR